MRDVQVGGKGKVLETLRIVSPRQHQEVFFFFKAIDTDPHVHPAD